MNSSRIGTKVDTVEGLLRERTPFDLYEYITVTFGSADTDYTIPTKLLPTNPEDIDYEVVRKDRSCDVYNDMSGTRRAWKEGYIVLRSTVANAVVDLRLSVRRT